MARWEVTISGKGVRKASVEKLAAKMKEEFGEDVSIHVTDASPPESRSDRLSAALGDVSGARSEVESLRDELQEWYDNLPENFQNGDKGSELTEAIGSLEEIMSGMEDIEGRDGDVSFPTMY